MVHTLYHTSHFCLPQIIPILAIIKLLLQVEVTRSGDIAKDIFFHKYNFKFNLRTNMKTNKRNQKKSKQKWKHTNQSEL